ncbi:MAG: site-specific integrase, partial [Polyangiaceae bacterium]|nr:site-specific integrase [Polyangiaceae bacterium]
TLIARGDYSPNTANGWLSILRVVFKAAARDFELPRIPVEHVRDFDTSDHITYSEEAPQSLTPAQVSEFLAILGELYPQHYAITYLGFCTGLRQSSLRPLRRKGDQPDILWEEGRLLVRRSQTRGQEVLQTTKQRTRYSINLPPKVITVLRWHVAEQLTTPAQQDSELLFPSVNGGFRAPSVLNKPFAEVSEAMELGYHFTQKGMRRTFNDLARAAEVQDIVTRSISGHSTERMQHHYSTVRGHEQHEGLSKVVDLMTARAERASSKEESPSGGASGGASML